MNKLSRMIALLMLLTVATAYGTKYEYFRMTDENNSLELAVGDVAEVINYSTIPRSDAGTLRLNGGDDSRLVHMEVGDKGYHFSLVENGSDFMSPPPRKNPSSSIGRSMQIVCSSR